MQHRPRKRLWLAVLLIGTLTLLTGCGQKGPLYLPSPDQGKQAEATKTP